MTGIDLETQNKHRGDLNEQGGMRGCVYAAGVLVGGGTYNLSHCGDLEMSREKRGAQFEAGAAECLFSVRVLDVSVCTRLAVIVDIFLFWAARREDADARFTRCTGAVMVPAHS